MKDEADRALDLAQTILRDACARIEEEFEGAPQNAALIAFFGYVDGARERVTKAAVEENPMAQLLFDQSRMLGVLVGASSTNISDM